VNKSANAIDRLSGRIAVVVVSGAVLFVILAGWFVLVAPKRSKAADLDSKAADAQIQLSDTQRFLHSSAGRKSATELKKLTRAVPTDPRMSEILRQLSRASRVAGVRIDGITPAPMVATTGGQAIPLTVTVEGHYFRLQRFLHVLRSAAVVGTDSVDVSGRLLAIDSVQFASGSAGSTGTGKKGLITATLAVDAFVSTPGAGPATGQASTTDTTSTTSP
jgi:Tfp pilus assembly protein PilO